MDNNYRMEQRAKMILAMEYIARQVNDEDAFVDLWLQLGVADGDIKYGSFDISEVDEYYLEDDNFKYIMTLFLKLMNSAWNDGGLYCGGIVSKDKTDYKKGGED